ncbi:MAG TPA: hypothetical protein VHR66_10925 [Gemmataceae bacterium]|nr:hypothetical protein [Gemmataceae bacterium]
MLLIFGAGYVAVCERRAYEQLGKQYEQIYVVFRAGGRELDTVLDPPQPAIQRAHGSAERLFVSAVSDGSGQRAELTPNAVSEQASIATEKVDVARAQRIIEALGREMLQENAQWLLIRRSKPLELPLGA